MFRNRKNISRSLIVNFYGFFSFSNREHFTLNILLNKRITLIIITAHFLLASSLIVQLKLELEALSNAGTRAELLQLEVG